MFSAWRGIPLTQEGDFLIGGEFLSRPRYSVTYARTTWVRAGKFCVR